MHEQHSGKNAKLNTILLFLLSISVISLPGCEQKTMYPRKKNISTRGSTKKSTHITNSKSNNVKIKNSGSKSDVGVADVADYVTGVTPLKTKKFANTKLQNIYNKRNKRNLKTIQEK